jgi:signal transduction histidine kinase
VNNAIKHGRARRILIGLGLHGGTAHLTVEDDGSGIPGTLANHAGMGLLIMSYRANMIGGALDVRRGVHRGTIVECRVPIQAKGDSPAAKGRDR